MDRCRNERCRAPRVPGRFRKPKQKGLLLDGDWYCGRACLEDGLLAAIRAMRCGYVRSIPAARSLRPTLGLLLIEQGKVRKEELDRALQIQKRAPGSRIGDLLKYLGIIEEREITQALSRQYGIPWVSFTEGKLSESAVPLIPAVIARAYRAVPLDVRASEARLLLAIVGPPDYAFLNGLSRMLDLAVTVLVADQSKVERILERHYPAAQARGRHLDLRSAGARALADAIGALACQYEARSLRLERCGQRIWLRLAKESRHCDFLIDVELPDENEAYVS